MAKTRTLLLTKHGSHLYGMNHANSDLDYYEVFEYPWQNYRPKKQISQTINDESDVTKASIDRFTNLCYKGVPQSLEALFAPREAWVKYDDLWYDRRETIHENLYLFRLDILETYRRTARNFFQKDDFKKNRHAMRLIFNARDFKVNGQFNPRLEESDLNEITRLASLPWQQREESFKDLLWGVFGS